MNQYNQNYQPQQQNYQQDPPQQNQQQPQQGGGNQFQQRSEDANRFAFQDPQTGRVMLHNTFEVPLNGINDAPLYEVPSPEGRFVWAHIAAPRAYKNNAPKYSVEMIIPKTDQQGMMSLWASILAAAKKKHGEQIQNWALVLGYPIKDGDEYVAKGKGQHYANHWVITSAVKDPIRCYNANAQPLMDISQIYAGCWGRIRFNVSGYDIDGGKGVTYYFDSVMKTRDDERLDNRTDASQTFQQFADPNAGMQQPQQGFQQPQQNVQQPQQNVQQPQQNQYQQPQQYPQSNQPQQYPQQNVQHPQQNNMQQPQQNNMQQPNNQNNFNAPADNADLLR